MDRQPLSPVPSNRLRVRVEGVVQGVGFRPFVHGLATAGGLSGLVGNDTAGVFIEIEGTPGELDRFLAALEGEAPPLARLAGLVSRLSRASRPGSVRP
jgi:hydrogenase maturation protein HypF